MRATAAARPHPRLTPAASHLPPLPGDPAVAPLPSTCGVAPGAERGSGARGWVARGRAPASGRSCGCGGWRRHCCGYGTTCHPHWLLQGRASPRSRPCASPSATSPTSRPCWGSARRRWPGSGGRPPGTALSAPRAWGAARPRTPACTCRPQPHRMLCPLALWAGGHLPWWGPPWSYMGLLVWGQGPGGHPLVLLLQGPPQRCLEFPTRGWRPGGHPPTSL